MREGRLQRKILSESSHYHYLEYQKFPLTPLLVLFEVEFVSRVWENVALEIVTP